MNTDNQKKTSQKQHQHSLRWRMIGILLICWLIPFTCMIGILGVYLADNHSDMTAQNFRDQLEFNNQICVERLNGVIAASREASYDGDLLEASDAYRAGRTSYLQASRIYKEYLTAKYQKNNAVSSVVLWFQDEFKEQEETGGAPDTFYCVYNSRANGSYQQIRNYQEQDHLVVAELAGELGTRIGFLKRGRRLYLIRNLVDSHFQPQGTLVFCLNRDYCFDSLSEYPMADGIYAEIDREALELKKNDRLRKWEQGHEETEDGYEWVDGRLCVSDVQQGDNYTLYTSMILQKEVSRYPFYGYPYVLAAMVLCLLPMLLLMLYAFRKQVTDPVKILSEGAGRIETGELGYQIREPLENSEFTYLRDSFNEMSAHLKQQFDRIYQEEVMLREARIMALQSHINPHFMNNTLEIINWEARLGGNQKVSKMIEALSTVLDAAMDRRKRPQVCLSEEMVYVNAYLYITKERLGKRLTVEVEIPEELMDALVPRLILQPLIENAVEHGVVPNGNGTVVLCGYEEKGYLCLEIVNDGGLSQEDRKRVDRLLDPNYNTGNEPAGNMGIANVNQRLRILYGEPCGLTITEEENKKVIAKITIPLQKLDNSFGEMNKKEQEMPDPVI